MCLAASSPVGKRLRTLLQAKFGNSDTNALPQVSFSDLAMAEYAAARVAASKPPPLPERLVRRHPPAVRSWRMAVLRYNAWRRASTVAKRQCDARAGLLLFCISVSPFSSGPESVRLLFDGGRCWLRRVACFVSSHGPTVSELQIPVGPVCCWQRESAASLSSAGSPQPGKLAPPPRWPATRPARC